MYVNNCIYIYILYIHILNNYVCLISAQVDERMHTYYNQILILSYLANSASTEVYTCAYIHPYIYTRRGS